MVRVSALIATQSASERFWCGWMASEHQQIQPLDAGCLARYGGAFLCPAGAYRHSQWGGISMKLCGKIVIRHLNAPATDSLDEARRVAIQALRRQGQRAVLRSPSLQEGASS